MSSEEQKSKGFTNVSIFDAKKNSVYFYTKKRWKMNFNRKILMALAVCCFDALCVLIVYSIQTTLGGYVRSLRQFTIVDCFLSTVFVYVSMHIIYCCVSQTIPCICSSLLLFLIVNFHFTIDIRRICGKYTFNRTIVFVAYMCIYFRKLSYTMHNAKATTKMYGEVCNLFWRAEFYSKNHFDSHISMKFVKSLIFCEDKKLIRNFLLLLLFK